MIVAVVVGGCVWEGIKKYRGKTKKKKQFFRNKFLFCC